MGRLIPLVLHQTSQTTFNRFSSNPPSDPPAFELPPIPTKSKKRDPGLVTDLTIVPYTSTEWRNAMAEFKELYDKRQYKQCSARCKALFENIKNSYEVHPIYSIYIAFYAASSIELIARSLHNNSSAKLSLFQEALTFYEKAESYIQCATLTTDPHTSKHNSTSSSIRSSSSSIFSQISLSSTSTASSILSSPTSVDSDADPQSPPPIHHPQSWRTKKKVSFSELKPETITESDNDDDDERLLLDSFPSPPSHDCTSPTTSPQARTTTAEEKSHQLESKARDRALALTRYHTHLFALSTQLTYHTTSIHSQIHVLSLTRRSKLPDSSSYPSSSSSSLGVRVPAEEKENKKADLEERIRRGRETGWVRKRFEGRRYRELCERAMGEVEGGVF
ncbi:hypothetical protein LOCC1_G002996 [Lachnellula occidentalis]|uniref:Uncharacterized protein n=1 Tax=Lachnellula occidentalis TaxID=215460 RepID=A0A8H8RZ77_9HELO|nr:hypothetical protein LOCC1_G002996 [Lachnellula occidentalis]